MTQWPQIENATSKPIEDGREWESVLKTRDRFGELHTGRGIGKDRSASITKARKNLGKTVHAAEKLKVKRARKQND